MTAAAMWLNEVFASFDSSIFDFAYSIHTSAGAFFDPFFKTITHFADYGLFFIAVAAVMLFFRKTRKNGLALLVSLLIGLIAVNLIIKNAVYRPRPYVDEASVWFRYWTEIGFGKEIDFPSFPSGHSYSAFVFGSVIFYFNSKKWSWSALVLSFLIAFSRIYIFVHYPSDVVAGALIGVLCAVIGTLIVDTVYKKIKEKNKKGRIFDLFREEEDNDEEDELKPDEIAG